MTSTIPEPTYRPWFDRWPGLGLLGIVVLFAAITALRVALGDDATVGVTLFYVVPISLMALAWGRLGGLITAGVALVLLALWALVSGAELTPLGWAARVVPIIFAGFLLGDTSDRLRRAQEAYRRQLEREMLHRQAVEVNDSLIQGMAAAKWAIEAGRPEQGLKTLDETIGAGQQMVSKLIRESGMGPVEPGPRQSS